MTGEVRSGDQAHGFVDAILDTVAALVVVVDPTGHVLRCNTAFLEATGFDLDDVLGGPLLERMVPAEHHDAAAAEFARLVQDRTPRQFEGEILTADGPRRRIRWNDALLVDAAGDLQAVIGTGLDVTEQRSLEDRLAQRARLESVGRLAAGLAHEVNNPLSGMLNAARRLKKKEGLDERAKDYIELIEEGLSRIENLMKQILDFSRRRDMKPERFSPEKAFHRALPLVRHRLDKKQLRLEEDIRQDLSEVYGNEEEIGQVLMNLLINATDASPEGSAVRVTIMPSDAGGVLFSVEDSGDGVPLDIRERIFDPFFTTKDPGKGTGLGLAIAHTVIDNHGGSIRIEDGTTLKGARFVVELPRADLHESRRNKEIV